MVVNWTYSHEANFICCVFRLPNNIQWNLSTGWQNLRARGHAVPVKEAQVQWSEAQTIYKKNTYQFLLPNRKILHVSGIKEFLVRRNSNFLIVSIIIFKAYWGEVAAVHHWFRVCCAIRLILDRTRCATSPRARNLWSSSSWIALLLRAL